VTCASLDLVRKVVENVQRDSTVWNLKGKNPKVRKKVGEIMHAEKISEPNAISSKTKTTEMSDSTRTMFNIT